VKFEEKKQNEGGKENDGVKGKETSFR